MINEDGSGLEQITYDKVFDSFPMFSPDGNKIISLQTEITEERVTQTFLLLIGLISYVNK